VTASFAKYSQFKQYYDKNRDKNKIGFLDFYDYHRYYDPIKSTDFDKGELEFWDDNHWPCIIGEVGHEYGDDPRDYADPFTGQTQKLVDEAAQKNSSKVVMENALNQGYLGVLLWRYTPVSEDAHRLLIRTRSQISQFHNEFHNVVRASAGSPLPFRPFERLIWKDCIPEFVKDIDDVGRTPQ
jgi:hypothetical protein